MKYQLKVLPIVANEFSIQLVKPDIHANEIVWYTKCKQTELMDTLNIVLLKSNFLSSLPSD